MRKVSVVAIMGLCFVAGIAFVYSCGGGSSSSAATINELEDRVLALESSSAATFSELEDRALALENRLTPAYDSGWRNIAVSGALVLTHNLVGNLDDYLIDVTQRWNALPNLIHKWYPGDYSKGVSWEFIPSDFCPTCPRTITIRRGATNNYGEQVRVRIWDLGS